MMPSTAFTDSMDGKGSSWDMLLPSQIVQFIDSSIDQLAPTQRGTIQLSSSTCGWLNALIRLVDGLPNSLLPNEPVKLTQLMRSCETIRFSVQKAQTSIGGPPIGLPEMRPDQGTTQTQVTVIRGILADCPDEVVPHQSNELRFIRDADARDGLLLDLTECRTSVRNDEWKSATVLAGSLVEALLFWSIKESQKSIPPIDSLRKNRPPEEWYLGDYLDAAKKMKIISVETAKQVELAQEYRNLIHPGRVFRKRQMCNRGTAFGALAAVELVIQDLAREFKGDEHSKTV